MCFYVVWVKHYCWRELPDPAGIRVLNIFALWFFLYNREKGFSRLVFKPMLSPSQLAFHLEKQTRATQGERRWLLISGGQGVNGQGCLEESQGAPELSKKQMEKTHTMWVLARGCWPGKPEAVS